MPSRLREPRARAASTRTRRIIWAAMAKNCAPRLPFPYIRDVHEAEINFMDQRSGLHGITLRFVFQIAPGHEPQFGIDMLGETGQGGLVTAAPGSQQIRDFRGACVDGSRQSPMASTNIREAWPDLCGHCRLYRRRGNKRSP